MKDRFKLFSMALCACAFAACNDNEGVDIPTQFSHDLFVSYNFGKKSEFTVSAECTNIFNARLYDNFKMQKPGRAFAIKFGYSFMK